MSEPSATAEKPVREQLHDLFLEMARRSFATSMDSLNRVNIYDGVIAVSYTHLTLPTNRAV